MTCDLQPLEPFGADLVVEQQGLVVRNVTPASVAARAGLLTGDRITRVAGIRARGSLDWSAAMASLEFEKPMPIEFERGSAMNRTAIVFRPRAVSIFATTNGVLEVAMRLAQGLTLVLGIAIALRATGTNGLFAAGLLGTIGVYSLSLPPRIASLWRLAPAPLGWLLAIPLISSVVIGGWHFLFFLTFPKSRRAVGTLLLWCAPLLPVIVWQARFIAALVYGIGDASRSPNARWVTVPINAAYLAVGLFVLIRNAFVLPDAAERRRVRLIAAGCTLGVLAGTGMAVKQWLVQINPADTYSPGPIMVLAIVCAFATPIAFWTAIVRHQLFDIRLVLRKGLQYVVARRALLAAAPVVVTLVAADVLWHEHASAAEAAAAHVIAYGAVVGLFLVVQIWGRAWLRTVDGRLFRDHFEVCERLRALGRTLRDCFELPAAAEILTTGVNESLSPRWVVFYARGTDDKAFSTVAGHGSGTPRLWPTRGHLIDFVRALDAPLPLDAEEPLDPALIVPVQVGSDRNEAMLVVGPKASGVAFVDEELVLLGEAARSLTPLLDRWVASRRRRSERLLDLVHDDESVRRLSQVADAVAEGSEVDWADAGQGSHELSRIMAQLGVLARISHHYVSGEDVPARAEPAPKSPEAAFRSWGPLSLTDEIGRGSFGTVYRAWDPRLERQVALKLLDRGARTGSAREWRLLARVKHPNVVAVYGADESEGIAGFWMEFIEGQTLKAILDQQGVFSPEEAAVIGDALCRALAAVHEAGLLHQDIKAQNVMRERGGRLVLMDFGSGLVSSASAPAAGTPVYMAPELFTGGAASPVSDIYSTGVLLFHLLTTRFPVPGASYAEACDGHARNERLWLSDCRADLPPALINVIERAIAPDPGKRFATPGAFATALREASR